MKTRNNRTKFKIDEITLILVVALLAMIIGINRGFDQHAEMEIEKITASIFDGHELGVANNGFIDEDKLMEIQDTDYNELKRLIKAKNDFCIYIEDEDRNIILSKGTDKLSISDIHCIGQ